MIDVHARLPNSSVFLAGEIVECHVTFRSPNTHLLSQSHSDREEVLAWASAQIHCQCTVDDTVVNFPSSASQEELATASQDTSFVPCKGESGHIVLSTKPKILFCDLKLSPGESKTFVYRETLPKNAPPSYRGHCVKYAYKITIGTQRVNALIKLLKIPIRVMVLYGVPEECESDELLSPANPFLQKRRAPPPPSSQMQLLEAITSRRTPSYYNITNQSGRVVRFCLLKQSYRLGEDIVGTFDFSQAQVKCVQFSVTLVSEEEVNGTLRHTVAHSKHHEFALHLRLTHMALTVPLAATPAVRTDIVCLKWKLHFEFVTTSTDSSAAFEDGGSWRGPSTLDVQTMVWDLPVDIFPAHPLQVAHGLPTKLHHTLTL